MTKPNQIELCDGTVIPILHEDRSVMVIDKPAGWMLVPYNWDKTSGNLHLAISSSILARDFWARSRNLKYLRHVHRLDADTSGLLLMAKSPGAVQAYSRLFESRCVEKTYLAVVRGVPKKRSWVCRLKVGPDPAQIGRMRIDARRGKDAETHFRVLQAGTERALVEAEPVTGRTHQIRLHLAACGHPVLGDALYGPPADGGGEAPHRPQRFPLGLRAVGLSYRDPFLNRSIQIRAPATEFLATFGFQPIMADLVGSSRHTGPVHN